MKRISTKAILLLATAILSAGPATARSWQDGPDLNHPRGFAAMVVDPCGNILMIGGMERTSASGGQLVLSSIEMLAFDGTSYATSWATLPTTLPIERMHHTAVCSGRFLYVIGGSRWGADPDFTECILTVDRYDFLTETWDSTSVPPLPYGRGWAASVVDRFGRIWVIGGGVCNAPTVSDSALVYDPAVPELGWQVMDSLNTARGFLSAAVDPVGRIWAIGGGDYSQQFISMETINDSCSADEWTLSSAALPSPASIYGPTVLGSDGLLYQTGGWVNNNYTSTVQNINPRNPLATWMPTESLGLARAGHSAVLGLDRRIYVAGGEANGVVSQASVESLDTRPQLADVNEDGVVDFFDIDAFLAALFGS